MKISWKAILTSFIGCFALLFLGFLLVQLAPKPLAEGVFFSSDGERIAALHLTENPAYHNLTFGYVYSVRKVDGDFWARATSVGQAETVVFEDRNASGGNICRLSVTIKDGRTIQINPLDGCTSEQVSATYGTFIRRVTGTVETCSSQASEYAFAAYVESRCIEFPFLSPLIGRNLAVDGCSQIKADSWWSDWKISRAESQATKQLETTYGEQPSEASCTILKGIYQQKYDNLK